MHSDDIPPIPQALISYAALERVFSPERLSAYADPANPDPRETVARYLWELALVSAVQPVLHTLEVAFRNEIARAASKLTASRTFRTAGIPSWLDAIPTMLMEREREKVLAAKERLGSDRRRWTEGRLIARLDCGFWVTLCRDSYADTRGDGPRLWPRALDIAFQKRPRSVTTRAEVLHRFDRIRRFRNRVRTTSPSGTRTTWRSTTTSWRASAGSVPRWRTRCGGCPPHPACFTQARARTAPTRTSLSARARPDLFQPSHANEERG